MISDETRQAAERLRLAHEAYGPQEWGYWEDWNDVEAVLTALDEESARAERVGKDLVDLAQGCAERQDLLETTIARLLRHTDHEQARSALQSLLERSGQPLDTMTIAGLVIDLFAKIDEANAAPGPLPLRSS